WASSYSPDKNSSNLQYPLNDITGISHIDGYGNLGLEGPDDRSPYHLNANIAEHALLLSDFGLNDEVGHAVNLLTSKGDDISSLNPETYKISSSSWAAANAAGGRYFYFIDPVLFARSVNLNEPLDQLLSYRPLKWLSGQAVEGMLVGSRPMLEIPADVIFMGNEWNEKDRSLEFSLKSKDQNAVTSEVVIRNCDGIKKIGSDIAFQYDSETRKAFFSIELKGKETVKVFFK
ncbi:MAG: hypothetical protein U9P14_00080, partial [Gemmatimonadota bacterium]|nr:hypothetical protein [Gemmatimonadota bacterium]